MASLVPLLPSAIATSAIDSVLPSSLRIVPVARPSKIVAPATLVMLTENFSFTSTAVSPLIVTVKVLLVWPAGIDWPLRLLAT